jgi:broad-specificity NMP kinase
MSLIYITGISGSGKSEVRKELLKRGFEAYGTDEDGLAAFYNRSTGEVVVPPKTALERNPKWRLNHTWKVRRDKVKELATKANNKPIFLCGVIENDAEVWDLFSKVVALVIDEDTLKRRIQSRTNNNFGQNPHEFEAILGWQKTAESDYKGFGAIIVDGTEPIGKVVDTILTETNTQLL